MKCSSRRRPSPRSFWGGNFSREDGLPRGQNQLGRLLMDLRDAN
jgi:hypothetical protein